jgi:DNA-binding response OmpR family regulator
MAKRILIVDDDINFIKRVFNRSSHLMISVADSLSRAEDLLNYEKYDLVVANSRIPGGSGLSVKSMLDLNTRICFVSGIKSDVEQIKESGDVCFHKYDLDQCVSGIEAYVS